MIRKFALLMLFLSFCTVCRAQSSVTLYGILDQFVAYEHTSSGKSLVALGDGALARSRIGFKGVEDIGGGYQIIFQLESGFNADSGALADSSRLFDRQAWVGINTPVGQFRVGRQNSAAFNSSPEIDWSSRAMLTSIVNNFGLPGRYDDDIVYKSPRVYDFQIEAHYAMPGIAGGGLNRGAVYQIWVDWAHGPYQAAYVGTVAVPLASAIYKEVVQYHQFTANYDYGRGKFYFAYIHSNNATSSASGNDAVGILSAISVPNNYVLGTTPDVQRFYNVFQVSVDYRISPAFTIGALIGMIRDQSGQGNDVYGGNVGFIYSVSKRTSFYGSAGLMKNENNAGFRFSGSGAPPNFTGSDINGRNLIGLQLGILHLF
ncbi:gram-negative porin family protein [Paraburkholderia xenovorans LB400]|uniref:Outer membrane porin, OmpC family n=1 Tax=Paraburkholderia xenovorans (strain LB400) TaxID=266265 RepID=Q13GH9_PARXL|nr:porin [Paraburkholderia xenovorans]ABE36810.1 outer membrane porin, OmpC family [Paraburkholderia xenovorans LB400]AIP35173.1 gram-negative porin family protein [Paraburkholderia xenovorans LB400]